MATYTPQLPTGGGGNGRMVKVAATSTPGTELHTCHATDKDEVTIWAVNSDTTDRKLTIELGGTTSPDDLIEQTIPAESGFKLVVPGARLSGSVVVRGFAATANVVMCLVIVNRISA